jgi:hypothetical protein
LPLQLIRRHLDPAPLGLELGHAGPAADPGPEHLRGGRHLDHHLVRVAQADDRGLHVLGGGPARRHARREAGAGAAWLPQPVEAEAAPVGAVEVPGRQVPAATEPDEAVRLHVPRAGRCFPRRVLEAQTVAVAAGLSDRHERVDVHRRRTG